MKKYFVVVSLLVSSIAFGQTADEFYTKALQLEKQFKEEDALNAALQCIRLNPNHYFGQCRAAFLYARCGNRLTQTDSKTDYFVKAKRHATLALKLKPDDAEAHYVMTIAMGRMALISGPSEKVGAARDIKKHVDAALKANLNHGGAWYLLGKWHYEMANLNFAEVAAAKYFFGGIPDGASLVNATQAFQKAISLDNTRMLYRYDLALTYVDMDKRAAAIKELELIMKMKQTDQDDPSTLREAKALLQELKN